MFTSLCGGGGNLQTCMCVHMRMRVYVWIYMCVLMEAREQAGGIFFNPSRLLLFEKGLSLAES